MPQPINYSVANIPNEAHWEETDLIVMSRILGRDATPIVQADVTSIACKVFVRDTGVQVGSTEVPIVADSIFDTLQTDERWTKDATGYNFRHTVSGELFPDGGVTYRVEIMITPTSGRAYPAAIIDVETVNLLSL